MLAFRARRESTIDRCGLPLQYALAVLGHRLVAFSRRVLRVARRRNPPKRWVSRLVNSGLFDRDYYEAQTGQRYVDDAQAVRHFLSVSPHHSYSFHPLVEPAWIERQVGDSASAWHAHLFRGHSLESTGPLFDLTVMRARLAAGEPIGMLADGSAGGTPSVDSLAPARLLHPFLSTSVTSPLLPVAPPFRQVAWPDAHVALRRLAELTARQIASDTRRNPTHWDAAGEQRFLATLGPVAEPADPAVPTEATAPLVSVIMPTYNRASLIGAAIDSVRRQSITAWELIVVDDGSTDDTVELLARLQRDDSRIRVVMQANEGVSAARNNGIEHAAGHFVAFLDSDNTWTPDFLRASLAEVQAKDAPGSFSAVEIQLDGGGREYLGAPARRHDLLDGRNLVDLNALIVRRDVLVEVGGFDTGLRRWVDYDLVLRLLRDHELVYVPMIGVIYDHRASAGDRITTSESPLWRTVVLEKNLVDWAQIGQVLDSRVAGRTSVLIRTRRQWADTLATVESLLQQAGNADLEIVVIDTASPRDEAAILTAAFLGDERVHVQRTATDVRQPTALNLAFAASTGDQIVVMQPGALAAPRWVGASEAISAVEFSARHGFSPMPEGDPSGESLLWRDLASA